MSASELFGPLFAPARLRDALSARAWVAAMLETEEALAAAEAAAGVIPAAAADAIAAACRAGAVDVAGLGEASLGAGNPVVPLVERLRAAVGGDAAAYVHWGATSQDVLDTAATLVARRALALATEELDEVARGCGRLAREHAGTLMAGRTLLQQALPITFGLKAAGWLDAALDARVQPFRAYFRTSLQWKSRAAALPLLLHGCRSGAGPIARWRTPGPRHERASRA